MRQLSERQLPNYLLGSLSYSAVRWQTLPDAIEQGLDWYRHLTGLGHYHLPFYLVLDLGLLIQYGYETPFASDQDYQKWPEEHRAIRLRYENELLARLLQEPVMLEIFELLKHEEAREGRRHRLLELLMNSLAPQYPRKLLLHPAHLRQLYLTPTDIDDHPQRAATFLQQLEQPNFYIELLNTFLDQVARNIQWSELLQKEDLFELEHWDLLHTEELRIGCRQILEVERSLGNIDTRTIHIPEENPDTETAFIDETYYPTGGLTELTNRGSFENLVLSELIYIEGQTHGEIDLFDVRFVEGELLFYKRDAGQLRRKRRTVHLIIDLGSLFHLKSTGYQYQLSILTQGLLLRITHDLFQVFVNDAICFHFHYLTQEGDPKPVEREARLMQLLLKDEEQHGWVHFHISSTLQPEDLQEDTRKVYAIAITQHGTQWDAIFDEYQYKRPALLGLSVHVTDNPPPPTPNAHAHDDTPLTLPLQGMPFHDVISLKKKIINKIISLHAK